MPIEQRKAYHIFLIISTIYVAINVWYYIDFAVLNNQSHYHKATSPWAHLFHNIMFYFQITGTFMGWIGDAIWGGWIYFYTIGAMIQTAITVFLFRLTSRIVITLGLLACFIPEAFAAEITPHSLRMLIEKSKCIVVATVVDPGYSGPPDSAPYANVIAQLKINETLKGQPNDSLLDVAYIPFVVCPESPSYPQYSTVIAFLNKEKEMDPYYTVALSYGSKLMHNDDELNAYRARILEYATIEKIKSPKKLNTAFNEWLVKCIESKYTRWEGLAEFTNGSDLFYHHNRTLDSVYSEQLSRNQIHRIKTAFFAADTIGYNELCMINFIPRKNHIQIKQRLIDNLPMADYHLSKEIMQEILLIDYSKALDEIYQDSFNLLDDDPEKEVKQKRLVDEFINAEYAGW